MPWLTFERNVLQQVDTAEHAKVQTENDDRPANITLTRARKVTFAIDGYEPTPRQTIRHSSS